MGSSESDDNFDDGLSVRWGRLNLDPEASSLGGSRGQKLTTSQRQPWRAVRLKHLVEEGNASAVQSRAPFIGSQSTPRYVTSSSVN